MISKICTDSIDETKEMKRIEIAQHVAAFLKNKKNKIRQVPAGASAYNNLKFSLFNCALCTGSENRKHGTPYCKPCYDIQARTEKAKREKASAQSV